MPKLGVVAALTLVVALAGCGGAPDKSAEATASETPEVVQVDPRALAPCAELRGHRVTAEDCEAAKTAESKVRGGLAAFNWPQSMEREKAVTLRLAIGEGPPPEPADTTQDAVAVAEPPSPVEDPNADPGDGPAVAPTAKADPTPAPPRPPPPSVEDAVQEFEGETVTYAPRIADFMSARLTGEGFKIEPQSKEHQEILPDSITIWDWKVTPIAGGKRTLTIITQPEFKDAAGNYIPLRTLPQTKTVEVVVPWWQTVRDWVLNLPGWLKALTAVVTGLTALATAVVALRAVLKGKPESPAS